MKKKYPVTAKIANEIQDKKFKNYVIKSKLNSI